MALDATPRSRQADIATSVYTPPPATVPPPPGWRPPQVMATAPPRTLPAQDHAAIDAAEDAARRVTLAIGAAALVALTLLFAVLCGQLLG